MMIYFSIFFHGSFILLSCFIIQILPPCQKVECRQSQQSYSKEKMIMEHFSWIDSQNPLFIKDLQLGDLKEGNIIQRATIALLLIMMNRRQKRLQIIQYFLRVAQAQEEVQSLQNDLISHFRFNPTILFKKVGANGHVLTIEQLRNYIQRWTSITDREIIRAYTEKHHFHANIKLKEFAASLLPYTPNVLREATQKIDKQMETKHLDRVIQDLYQKLLASQLKNIYEISLFQKNLPFDWAGIKSFILKELNEKSRIIDLQKEQCSMVAIRRWLQMWIGIDEYNVLNMMRWFGGSQEAHIERYYYSSRIQPKCTCNSSHSSRKQPSSLSKQLLSCSKEKSTLKKVRSTPKMLNSTQPLKHFLRYVETIVKSQRRLELLREELRTHKRQVEIVLHEIASKRNSFTKLGKIISQIQKVLRINPDMVNKLLGQLENSKIDNNFLFSLFAAPSKKGSHAHKLTQDQMLNEIYEVLYTFCLSKATLKSIARDIKGGGVDLVFQQLDYHNRKFLDKADLKFILSESNINCKKDDLSILMNHFGDGQRITPESFREVFEIQSRC